VTTIFVERLRSLREIRGLKQADVADKAGIERSTYRGYENPIKQREPNTETLARIAKALNTTTDYLLGVTEQILPLLHDSKNMDPVEMQARREIEELFSRKNVLTGENIRLIADFTKMLADQRLKTQEKPDENGS